MCASTISTDRQKNVKLIFFIFAHPIMGSYQPSSPRASHTHYCTCKPRLYQQKIDFLLWLRIERQTKLREAKIYARRKNGTSTSKSGERNKEREQQLQVHSPPFATIVATSPGSHHSHRLHHCIPPLLPPPSQSASPTCRCHHCYLTVAVVATS